MKPHSTHGLSIEPRHFLVGVALGWIEPHLDAAAAPSAIVAKLVGVTPDFLTQSSRCGEVEGEGMAGGSHRALVMPYIDDGRPLVSVPSTISGYAHLKIPDLHTTATHLPTPAPLNALPTPPTPYPRSSSIPCASCSCR